MSLLCAVWSMVLWAMPTTAQVTLRYQWRVGDAFILDKVIDVAGTIRAGTAPARAMSQRARVRKKLTVEQVDPQGQAQLRVALLSVSATKSVGEEQVQYSLTPDQIVLDNTRIWQRSAKQEQTSPNVEHLQQLFMPRGMSCSPRGKTRDPFRPEYAFQGASRADVFSLFGVGEEGWLLFADSPVNPGDAWQDEPAETLRSGTSELWYNTRLRLERLAVADGQSVARIGFQRESRSKNLAHEFTPSALSPIRPVAARLIESQQQFTGSVDFDVDQGRVLRCDAEGQARLRYSLQGGRLSDDLRALPLEYDWSRIRVRTDWQPVANSD